MVLVDSRTLAQGANGFDRRAITATPRGRGQGGRRVALRWRIRHKLLLGLGVVVGIIALLLTGTLQGLASFTSTVRTADSRLVELHDVDELKRQIDELRFQLEGGAALTDQAEKLGSQIQSVR